MIVNFTPRSFYLRRKEPPIPIGQETRLAPGMVYTLWRQEQIPVATWNRTPVV